MAPPSNDKTPTAVAIERLAKLSGQGASPAKMIAAVEDLLIAWTAEDLDPDDLRDRIETLQSDMDAGIQAAEDYRAETDTEAGKATATKQLDGLTAARDRLTTLITR